MSNNSLVIANLESSLTKEQEKYSDKAFSFKADFNAVKVLKETGVNTVTLANNHIMDYGPKGLMGTIKTLKDAGIAYFGAGGNIEEAQSPLILNKKEIKIGFLGYSSIYTEGAEATDSKAGVSPLDPEYIKRDIEKLKKTCDIVILSFHWGGEYVSEPSQKQRKTAHLAIDSGADIVLGHHPHVLQGIEKYKGKLIAYSLGNFLFDQNIYSTIDSIILTIFFDKKANISFSVTPIARANFGYYPTIAKGRLKKHIINKLKKLSAKLNTTIADSEIN